MRRFGLILGMMLIAVLVPTAVFADDAENVETQMNTEIAAVVETVAEITESEVVIIEDQMIPVLGAEAIEAEAEAAMEVQEEAVETETVVEEATVETVEEIVEEAVETEVTVIEEETVPSQETPEELTESVETEEVVETEVAEEIVEEENVTEPEMITFTVIHRLFVQELCADDAEEITCEAGTIVDLSKYIVEIENVVCQNGAQQVIAEAGKTFVIEYAYEF